MNDAVHEADVTVASRPPIGSLAKALAAFQGKMPSVPKTKTANVPTKNGGSYSYSYADLAAVTAAAMPILAECGLSFICLPEEGSRGFILRGILAHDSGETVEGFLPLYGGTNQELGSSLTYSRRYLLGALTGIVTDDDDDGNAAKDSGRTTKGTARQRAAAQPAASPEPPAEPIAADPSWGDKIAEAVTFDELTAVYNEADQLGVLGHMLGEETLKSRLYARRAELTSKGAQ